MTYLENMESEGWISLEMSQVAQSEAAHGGNLKRKEKAYSHIYTETLATTDQERHMLKQIEAIIFPVGTSMSSERNDVMIVFNAWKYGAYLVTNDGDSKRQPNGILGKRDELAKLDIKVLRDEEAASLVKDKHSKWKRRYEALGISE